MTTTQHSPTRRSGFWTVLAFEGRNRLRITGVIAVLFILYGGLYLWVGPSFIAGDAVQDLVDAFPPIMNQLFGFESLASMEGLFASEFYTFGWIVGLAGYLGYTAAGTIAGDIWSGRMDQLLAAPAPRHSVILGKYGALFVPVLILNLITPLFLFGGSLLIDAPLALTDLLVLHVLAVPYLLVWCSVGTLLGVLISGARTAGRLTLGVVFFAWIFESVIVTTDYAWAGRISPTHYFDPPAVLIHSQYDISGAIILTLTATVLLCVSLVVFSRRDI